jgi:hypothetical protein
MPENVGVLAFILYRSAAPQFAREVEIQAHWPGQHTRIAGKQQRIWVVKKHLLHQYGITSRPGLVAAGSVQTRLAFLFRPFEPPGGPDLGVEFLAAARHGPVRPAVCGRRGARESSGFDWRDAVAQLSSQPARQGG